MKSYAELIGNYKSQRIKSLWGNKLVCDSDYRGEYIVAMHNDTNQPQVVPAGARIAQLVIMPYIPVTMVQTDVLSETERSDGGFGSTGM